MTAVATRRSPTRFLGPISLYLMLSMPARPSEVEVTELAPLGLCRYRESRMLKF